MRGLASSSPVKFSLILALMILLLLSNSISATPKKNSKYQKPCNQLVLYMHDLLLEKSVVSNATSARVINATKLGDYQFGSMFVFNDPVTRDQNLHSPEAATAQGFYFYNMKTDYSAWFAYTLVFNSTEYKGTISIMGADLMPEKTRDLSVVGGTGDFFMARGIATWSTEAVEGIKYFRVKMDIKLYDC